MALQRTTEAFTPTNTEPVVSEPHSNRQFGLSLSSDSEESPTVRGDEDDEELPLRSQKGVSRRDVARGLWKKHGWLMVVALAFMLLTNIVICCVMCCWGSGGSSDYAFEPSEISLEFLTNTQDPKVSQLKIGYDVSQIASVLSTQLVMTHREGDRETNAGIGASDPNFRPSLREDATNGVVRKVAFQGGGSDYAFHHSEISWEFSDGDALGRGKFGEVREVKTFLHKTNQKITEKFTKEPLVGKVVSSEDFCRTDGPRVFGFGWEQGGGRSPAWDFCLRAFPEWWFQSQLYFSSGGPDVMHLSRTLGFSPHGPEKVIIFMVRAPGRDLHHHWEHYTTQQTTSQQALSWTGSETGVAKILTGVADELAGLHQKGFVHNDVKPANIVVDLEESGSQVEVKAVAVIDYGVALRHRQLAARLRLGEISHTPPFAPLRFDSSNHWKGKFESGFDLYGLAGVGMWMLLGHNSYITLYEEAEGVFDVFVANLESHVSGLPSLGLKKLASDVLLPLMRKGEDFLVGESGKSANDVLKQKIADALKPDGRSESTGAN